MSRPNIVFLIDDQHRWDFMGTEANGVTHTPNLDALARRGVVFHSAYCTAPLCSPVRAALHTGRYGMNSGCFTNLHQLPAGSDSFVKQLRTAGYYTCAVGKTHLRIHAYDADYTAPAHRAYMDSLGWSETHETSGQGMLRTGIRCAHSEFLRGHGVLTDAVRFYRQFPYFMDPDAARAPNPPYAVWTLPPEFQETTWVAHRAVQWLRSRPADQPFFLHVGFGAPHPPLEPLPEFVALYRDAAEPPPWGVAESTERMLDQRRGYRAMISNVDAAVGEIVRAVEEQGQLDDTVFLFTSDHGTNAGDHGNFGQCNFFEGSVHVPLLLAGPGIAKGRETHALVETLDVGRTLCELASVPPPLLDQGRSLLPILRGETETHRRTVYSEMGCDRMLFDGRYKLMWGDPLSDRRTGLGRLHLDKPVTIRPSPPRLYDLREDPHELRNLADDAHHADLLRKLMAELLARIIENTQPQPNQSRGDYRPLSV